ncbi:hypothetical protein AMTRI_Chr11g155050 [Amborella trichopoda]
MFCPLALLSYSTDTSSCRICRHLGPSLLSTCTDDTPLIVSADIWAPLLCPHAPTILSFLSTYITSLFLFCPILNGCQLCKAKRIPFDSYKKEALPSFKAGPHSSSLLELNSSPLLSEPLPEAFTNLSTFTRKPLSLSLKSLKPLNRTLLPTSTSCNHRLLPTTSDLL